MGSSSSKPVRSAAQAASRRQYPKQPTATPPPRPSPAAPPKPRQAPESAPRGPTYHSKEQPSTIKSAGIELDGRDPDFAASLRKIGPVTPTPTLSHSSTFTQQHPSGPPQGESVQTVFPSASNPALLVFTARQRVAKAAEQEAEMVGRPNFAGREYVDAFTLRQALTMRDRQGLPGDEIERMLRLKKGVLERLGGKGVVSEVA
ncbi:hypothetical protein HFD88_000477 [Aspergillus terreus]|nr:hypothetical protein HFD88_000477 [Aspergillus terreus]